MKIDRQRFLALTVALSGGIVLTPGCATEAAPPPAAAPPPPPTVVYVMVPAAPAPPPVPVPVPVPAPAPAPIATEGPDPYKGTPVHAQSCDPSLNRVGSAPACTLRAPGPTCESISDTKQECPTMSTLLKPRVAAAAVECLRRRSGTQAICEFNVSSICAYEALGSACIEPYAKAACDRVMARCGGAPRGSYDKMTRESCEAGVSGIADAKRAKFISCISESCRFETCLTYL